MTVGRSGWRRYTTCGVAVLGVLAAMPAGLAARDKAAKPDTSATDRLRDKLDQTELQMADLLMAPPAAGLGEKAAVRVRISYRAVIRNLYDQAIKTSDDGLRAQLVLNADELAAGLPAYDALVSQAPQWQNAGAPGGPAEAAVMEKKKAALQALGAFETAASKATQDFDGPPAAAKYVQAMSQPLAPLVAVDVVDGPAPGVWPQRAKDVAPAPIDPNSLPTVEDTITRMRQDNLPADLRGQFDIILPAIRDAFANPDTAAQAAPSYKLMLDCLKLAEALSSTAVLGSQARQELNHQLLLGLVLFKDQRTRAGALKRLAGVGAVAGVLRHLNKSQLTDAQRTAFGAVVQAAVAKLADLSTAEAGAHTLVAMDKLLSTYDGLVKAEDQPFPPLLRPDVARMHKAADARLAAMVAQFQSDQDDAPLDQLNTRLATLRNNFDCVAAMDDAMKAAAAYKPVPADGVPRKITAWGKAVAADPETVSPAAGEFGLFRQALSLLDRIRVELPNDVPAPVLAKLTGGHYDAFLARFQEDQKKLIASLASPTFAPTTYIAQLTDSLEVLKMTHEMAFLESPRDGMDRLLLWGAWSPDPAAATLLKTQLEEAVAQSYVEASHTARSAIFQDDSANWLSTGDARAAIHALAQVDRKYGAALHGDPAKWSTCWAKAATRPEAGAPLVGRADAMARVSLLLNEAVYKNGKNDTQGAQALLQEAVRQLGQLGQLGS